MWFWWHISSHSPGLVLTLDLSPSTCSRNTLSDTAFAEWPVISNLSIICPCHLSVLQILRQCVTPGLLGLPGPCHLLETMTMLYMVFVCHPFNIHVPAIVAISSLGLLPLFSFRISILSLCCWFYHFMWLPVSYIAICSVPLPTVSYSQLSCSMFQLSTEEISPSLLNKRNAISTTTKWHKRIQKTHRMLNQNKQKI